MRRIATVAVCWSLLIGSTVAAAQDSKAADDDAAIKGVYERLSSVTKDGEWEKGAALMTPGAQDEVCADMLVMSYGIRNSDVPPSMSDFEDAQEAIGDVLKKFKLDELKIKTQMIRFGATADTSDDDDVDEAMTQAARDREVATEAIKKVENRWDLIRGIQKSMAKLPFFQSPVLVGEITDIDITNDKALVTINPTPQKREEQGGAQVQIVAPPRVVNFDKVDGKWLFAGLNREKSEAAARRAFEKMVPGAGSDF